MKAVSVMINVSVLIQNHAQTYFTEIFYISYRQSVQKACFHKYNSVATPNCSNMTREFCFHAEQASCMTNEIWRTISVDFDRGDVYTVIDTPFKRDPPGSASAMNVIWMWKHVQFWCDIQWEKWKIMMKKGKRVQTILVWLFVCKFQFLKYTSEDSFSFHLCSGISNISV